MMYSSIDVDNSDEYDRLLFHRTRYVKKGRKEHTCFYCRKPIEKGQPKHQRVISTSDNPTPWTIYEHIGCQSFPGER